VCRPPSLTERRSRQQRRRRRQRRRQRRRWRRCGISGWGTARGARGLYVADGDVLCAAAEVPGVPDGLALAQRPVGHCGTVRGEALWRWGRGGGREGGRWRWARGGERGGGDGAERVESPQIKRAWDKQKPRIIDPCHRQQNTPGRGLRDQSFKSERVSLKLRQFRRKLYQNGKTLIWDPMREYNRALSEFCANSRKPKTALKMHRHRPFISARFQSWHFW